MGTREEGIEIGCRIAGTRFSPGSKTYSYNPGVKRQLRINKIKKYVHDSGARGGQAC